MSQQRITQAQPEDNVVSWLDLMAGLAEPLARHMLAHFAEEEWRDSAEVEALGRVAALFEAHGREVPPPILDALRKAAEAGRPVGLA